MMAAYRVGTVCGSCGRELRQREPLWFGAKVYVGMQPFLYRAAYYRPRIAAAEYRRTVLCRSCAPDWLSPEREGVVTQLCAYCERPMVYLFSLENLRRTLCSDACRKAFTKQTRRDRRAAEREKVCEVCGQGFTAARKDAKTCSPKCKQAAYRRRKREVGETR